MLDVCISAFEQLLDILKTLARLVMLLLNVILKPLRLGTIGVDLRSVDNRDDDDLHLAGVRKSRYQFSGML